MIREATLDEQREVYEEVRDIISRDYKNTPLVSVHWGFVKDAGATGSCLQLGILANKVLSKKRKGVLLPQEGFELDERGKLTDGVLRDYGIGVFSGQGRNEHHAKRLFKQTNARGYKSPVILPFASLDLLKDGVNVTLLDEFDERIIMQGEEARTFLEKFYWVGNSGVRGLYHDSDSRWYAISGSVDDSYSNCRVVDWIRAEGAAQNFVECAHEIYLARPGAKYCGSCGEYIETQRLQERKPGIVERFARTLGI